MSQYFLRVLFCMIMLNLAAPSFALSERDCIQLLSETDVNLSIVSTEIIPASDKLPAHCRVHGFILPEVNFELRLPQNWNGKFYMVGNGGYLGEFFDQSYGLVRGYATASTDTGHSGPDPRFAHDNRAAEIDFAFRSVHVTAQAAKRLIEAYYGSAPAYSYFRGCSTGGRQALMEAQRFPDDFDGWSIGAPIYDYTYKQIYNAAWVSKTLYGSDRKGYVSKSKLKLLGKAVYRRCDKIDGLEDGLIDDPRLCGFNPYRDLSQCPDGGDGNDCFTASQIKAIAKIYDGPGEDIYPGAVKGGEWLEAPDDVLTGGWDVYFTGME
ncbi:MAG: tannase/feruloyl esterase family alpha/beta hydrolase, partial [Gammaproteobacteria bacterium]